MKFDFGSLLLGGLLVAIVAAHLGGYIDLGALAMMGLEIARAFADFLAAL